MTAPAPAGFASRAAGLLEAAPVAALFLDPATGEALAGNAEAAQLLGCPSGHLPTAWAHVLGAVAPLRQRLLAVEATDRAEFFDSHLARPAGPPEAVLVRARRIIVEGRLVLTIGLVPTIRRNQAEMALAVASRRLEVALAGADLVAAGAPAGRGIGLGLAAARRAWLAAGCPTDAASRDRLLALALDAAEAGTKTPP